jgi:SagB-type dehydrogenase family enzyme
MPPLPAVRSHWPGKKFELPELSPAAEALSPLAKLLEERHSTRIFDDQQPISLNEVARFLQATARVRSKFQHEIDLGDVQPSLEYTARPYPSAGASYELELYLAIDKCEGLARGFYHYDAGDHALVAIDTRPQELTALLTGAQLAMDVPTPPQILLIITARFGRISWKYSSIAYALILKDVGVLLQTFYLMAVDMGLGGCAIGTVNIDLFARMTGIEFHIESPVGQFAFGRPSNAAA